MARIIIPPPEPAKPPITMMAVPTETYKIIRHKLRTIANGRNTLGRNCDLAIEILTALDECAVKVDAVG